MWWVIGRGETNVVRACVIMHYCDEALIRKRERKRHIFQPLPPPPPSVLIVNQHKTKLKTKNALAEIFPFGVEYKL